MNARKIRRITAETAMKTAVERLSGHRKVWSSAVLTSR